MSLTPVTSNPSKDELAYQKSYQAAIQSLTDRTSETMQDTCYSSSHGLVICLHRAIEHSQNGDGPAAHLALAAHYLQSFLKAGERLLESPNTCHDGALEVPSEWLRNRSKLRGIGGNQSNLVKQVAVAAEDSIDALVGIPTVNFNHARMCAKDCFDAIAELVDRVAFHDGE